MNVYETWTQGRLGRQIGVAVSPTHLYVAMPARDSDPGAHAIRTWPLAAPARGDDGWPSLAAVFKELRDAIVDGSSPAPPASAGAMAVALLPGLVQVRRLELPKLRSDKLRALLSRNAGRYFPTVAEVQLANGVPVARSTPTAYVTAAAPRRIVEAIVSAAHEAGFGVTTIGSAHGAWMAAARKRWPGLGREGGSVSVQVGTQLDMLYVERGILVGVRRLRTRSDVESNAAYELQHPEETAARYATHADGPEILPDTLYKRREARRRQALIRGGAGIAAAILIAAGGVLWRAHRTLREVILARDSVQAQVRQVTEAQSRMNAMGVALAGLRRVEVQGVRWSDVLLDMSDNLPADAYLVVFRAHHDSVSADGIAARGASVFERMDGAKLLDHVQSAGPIRRDAKRGKVSVDRFTVVARVPGGILPYTQTGKP